jgi:hypothetical protein
MAKAKNGKGKKNENNGIKDLVKGGENLPTVASATGEKGMQAGFEAVDESDIILPRLSLLQLMSKAVDVEDKNAPQPGQFMNTLTMETYKPPIEVVPVFYNKAAILFPEKLSDPILCQSRDALTGNTYGDCEGCEHNWASWESGPPACSAIHEFICVFKADNPEFALPFIISMMRTSAKAGKQWLSIGKVAGGPSFGASYLIGADKKENDHGKFYIYTVRPSGRIDPTPYERTYLSMLSAYRSGRIKTDYEESPDRIQKKGDDSFDPDEFKN